MNCSSRFVFHCIALSAFAGQYTEYPSSAYTQNAWRGSQIHEARHNALFSSLMSSVSSSISGSNNLLIF